MTRARPDAPPSWRTGRHRPAAARDRPRQSPRDKARAGPWRTGARRAVIVTALPLLVLTGGIALAAWISSGPGTASAKAGTAKPPTTTTVSAAAFTSGLLYPGGTGDALITVNNPNAYPVTVSSLATTGSASVTSGATGTCTTTGVTITTSTPSSTTIAAGGSATLTLSGAARMAGDSDTGCQGAVFSVPVTVTITSAAS